MKKTTLLLLVASLLPTAVLAWNTPGEDFSGELRLEGPVTSTRNPWVWKVGAGSRYLDAVWSGASSGAERVIPVSLPTLPVLLGKTAFATPAGREGLSPRVTYGKDAEGFSLAWTGAGIARVTLPVTGDKNVCAGTFTFSLQAAGVLRHEQNGQAVYTGVRDDLQANGLPGEVLVMSAEQVPGTLQTMFSGEGPAWLQTMTLSGYTGVSHFSDAALRRIEGVYGAQIMAGNGELRLNGAVPERWQASLPVSIEYQ